MESICLQIEQEIIYLTLQGFLTYSKNNLLEEYNKTSNTIFANVWLFARQLRATIILERDICNSFAIVITLNYFYKNFALTIAVFNHKGEKILNKIQTVLLSKEAKLWSKYIIRLINNLAII